MKNAWHRTHGDIIGALHNVQSESVIFQKDVFGSVLARKREIERRLRGIEWVLAEVDSASLTRLQADLLHEYEMILFQEETSWFQKSRERWIKLGSRNTAFFHAQTVIRRKKNKIHGLHLPSGEWCTDAQQLQEEAIKFFKTLFCTNEHLVTL